MLVSPCICECPSLGGHSAAALVEGAVEKEMEERRGGGLGRENKEME